MKRDKHLLLRYYNSIAFILSSQKKLYILGGKEERYRENIRDSAASPLQTQNKAMATYCGDNNRWKRLHSNMRRLKTTMKIIREASRITWTSSDLSTTTMAAGDIPAAEESKKECSRRDGDWRECRQVVAQQGRCAPHLAAGGGQRCGTKYIYSFAEHFEEALGCDNFWTTLQKKTRIFLIFCRTNSIDNSFMLSCSFR